VISDVKYGILSIRTVPEGLGGGVLMDVKGLERAIKKDESKVKQYVLRSKICNSGYAEHINRMIAEERTYKEIIDWAGKKGLNITPAQLSKHKKMLPFITEIDWEDQANDVSEAAQLEMRKDKLLHERNLTNVELAIETLQETVKASQITAVNELWGDIIPQMIENIKLYISPDNRHRISFKDAMDGLDKIVKIAQLLEDKPTVIQATSVDGKTEVEHKHTLENVGDGTAESVSTIALEAINKVNEALNEYSNSKPKH